MKLKAHIEVVFGRNLEHLFEVFESLIFQGHLAAKELYLDVIDFNKPFVDGAVESLSLTDEVGVSQPGFLICVVQLLKQVFRPHKVQLVVSFLRANLAIRKLLCRNDLLSKLHRHLKRPHISILEYDLCRLRIYLFISVHLVLERPVELFNLITLVPLGQLAGDHAMKECFVLLV